MSVKIFTIIKRQIPLTTFYDSTLSCEENVFQMSIDRLKLWKVKKLSISCNWHFRTEKFQRDSKIRLKKWQKCIRKLRDHRCLIEDESLFNQHNLQLLHHERHQPVIINLKVNCCQSHRCRSREKLFTLRAFSFANCLTLSLAADETKVNGHEDLCMIALETWREKHTKQETERRTHNDSWDRIFRHGT